MNHDSENFSRPEDASSDAGGAEPEVPGHAEQSPPPTPGSGPSSRADRGDVPDFSAAFEDLASAFKEAARKGRTDAKQAFEQAVPKLKQDFNKGAHDLAYAVSFAAAFGYEILRELTPDTLANGAREGQEAGRRAANDAIRRQRERQAREAAAKESAPPDSPDFPESAPA